MLLEEYVNLYLEVKVAYQINYLHNLKLINFGSDSNKLKLQGPTLPAHIK